MVEDRYEGYLYVVEYMGHRVQKVTGNGIGAAILHGDPHRQQHAEAAVSAQGDYLPVAIERLDAHRRRQPGSERTVIETADQSLVAMQA